jgi:hypothetical protein
MPWVNALAVAPLGKVIVSGTGAADSAEKRMTSTVKIARRPRIMVAVSTVTNRRKNRKFAGSSIWELF